MSRIFRLELPGTIIAQCPVCREDILINDIGGFDISHVNTCPIWALSYAAEVSSIVQKRLTRPRAIQ